MNLLVIDIGNSRCKSCFGNVNEGFPKQTLDEVNWKDIENHFRHFSTFDACMISSVNLAATQLARKALEKKVASNNLVFLNSKNSPIPLAVENSETLGADRIAAAMGAHLRVQSQAIVIDSGTAVTIDRIDDKGAFQGGTIFPGIALSLNSLGTGTSKLPHLGEKEFSVPELPGRNTQDAILAGVFYSHLGAAEKIVALLQSEFGEMPVLTTGGNGKWITQYANVESQYCESLVLEGLWHMGVQRLKAS